MIADRFSPISLQSLNAKAEMLKRLDNKYVLTAAELDRVAPSLAEAFDILEIGDKRSFSYRTCYFDTPDLRSYYDHSKGRRIRSKVRVRRYLDADDLCFVEVKLKDKRKITVKKRLRYDPACFNVLDDGALTHVAQSHRDVYGHEFPHRIIPVIYMQYERMTLVAKAGGERMTIDTHLQFWNVKRLHAVPEERFILETKSCFGRGVADRILRRAGFHPVGSCSKYCMGLAALGQARNFNRFLPAMRRLEIAGRDTIPGAATASQSPLSGAAPSAIVA